MDKFVPDIYQKSIFTIDYEALKKAGIKCLLFDLDNTMAPVHAKEPDKKTKDLFEHLKDMDFKVVIMSNNRKPRIAPFKEALNIDACARSFKPLKRKFIKVMKTYGFKDTEIVMIGDQLLTDILGGNRMGFTTILVNPISHSDIFLTRINRGFEDMIFKYLAKKGLFEKGEYYD